MAESLWLSVVLNFLQPTQNEYFFRPNSNCRFAAPDPIFS
jgi:hypothetical protein